MQYVLIESQVILTQLQGGMLEVYIGHIQMKQGKRSKGAQKLMKMNILKFVQILKILI